MKRTIFAILTVALLGGCATSTTPTNDARECVQNFTYDGSFFAGRTFNTHAFVNNVSQKTALQRAASYLTNDGWSITSINENLGIISASQPVSFGAGNTVPLNIGIEPKEAGVKVSLTFYAYGGVMGSIDFLQEGFCSIIKAVKGKPMTNQTSQAFHTVEEVRAAQIQLKALGYKPGVIDGKFGRKTSVAITNFQNDYGLTKSGILDTNTKDALLNASSKINPAAPNP